MLNELVAEAGIRTRFIAGAYLLKQALRIFPLLAEEIHLKIWVDPYRHALVSLVPPCPKHRKPTPCPLCN